ncbi:hypothetical protein K2173_009867 [Erythroxylum novogranatense]|uniref:Uncharacterized protein n=1 Tax=Erythroxylum novogranatense TaxID=1862640 RepID=A0AAV8T031_9ROSI|nr:hypothetical protein K2173_009867 [Erythroxylum novogranatense]
MEEQSEKALMRNLHKEQERERRRLRDRQRRQSMSVEEREKHLARRRRNYQLRRQQAEVAYLDLQPNQSIASNDEILMPTTDECCEMISSPSVTIQCNGLAQVSTDQRQQMRSADLKNSVALEIPAHKFSQLPMRPLLNHIKHLARSLHDPVDVVTNHTIAAELILQGNATSNCIPPKKLRLNHVKHIARALNSEVVKTEDAGDESKTEVVKNMLEEPKTFSANIDASFHGY